MKTAKTVILISGYKRSGKDYIANEINKILKGKGKVLSFADPMKEIIQNTFGITKEALNEYKNTPDEYGLEIKVYPNNQPQGVIKYINFREILQNFGTEGMKPVFGNDVWAMLTKQRTLNEALSIIPDFRFKVEYDVFKNDLEYKVITIRIQDDGINNLDTHSSENELKDFKFDYTIDNTKKEPLDLSFLGLMSF